MSQGESIHYSQNPVCLKCGGKPEVIFHRYWYCFQCLPFQFLDRTYKRTRFIEDKEVIVKAVSVDAKYWLVKHHVGSYLEIVESPKLWRYPKKGKEVQGDVYDCPICERTFIRHNKKVRMFLPSVKFNQYALQLCCSCSVDLTVASRSGQTDKQFRSKLKFFTEQTPREWDNKSLGDYLEDK